MKGSAPASRLHDPVAKLTAEFVGTFFLVLTIGCNEHSGSIGGALSVGAILMVMVFSLGSVSGAHLNPAVTFAVLLRGGPTPLRVIDAALYTAVQSAGAVLGALSYASLTGAAFAFAPQWRYTTGTVLSCELIYSFLLCYVVLNVATTTKDAGNQYFGLAIGFCVTAAAIACGHVSGASLNPAVSFGCLAAAARLHGFAAVHFWSLYIFTPFLGALGAYIAFTLVRPEEMGSPPPPPRPLPVLEEPRGEIYRIPRELERVDLAVGLSWELAAPGHRGGLEIDGSCMLFNKEGRCCGAVYYADKEDTVNGVVHYGLHTGELGSSFAHNDNDQIRFCFDRMQSNIHFMFFVVTLFSEGQHSLKDLRKCHARLIQTSDPARGDDEESRAYVPSQLAKYTGTFESDTAGNAYVCTMLYRGNDGRWTWEAVNKSYKVVEAGTYRMLEPQLKRLCVQRSELDL